MWRFCTSSAPVSEDHHQCKSMKRKRKPSQQCWNINLGMNKISLELGGSPNLSWLFSDSFHNSSTEWAECDLWVQIFQYKELTGLFLIFDIYIFFFKKLLGNVWSSLRKKHTLRRRSKSAKHFTLGALLSFTLTVVIVKAVENLTWSPRSIFDSLSRHVPPPAARSPALAMYLKGLSRRLWIAISSVLFFN